MADPGHRQILAGGAAQAPGADDQHAGLLERLLPLEVEGFEHDLAVVAEELGVAQIRSQQQPREGLDGDRLTGGHLAAPCSSTM